MNQTFCPCPKCLGCTCSDQDDCVNREEGSCVCHLTVGTKCWYVPGYREEHLIAILCVIKEVDIPGRFYWLDEPIGHGVDDDDLLTRNEAIIELMSRYQDEQDADEGKPGSTAQLESFRAGSQLFIADTWKNAGYTAQPKFPPLPDKKPWDEWINPQMVLDREGTDENGA